MGNETGTVAPGASQTGRIDWLGDSLANPGVTIINNSGIIQAAGRAIDTPRPFSSGSITLNNNAGAALRSTTNDAFQISQDISEGTITVNNNGGTIAATGAQGQALDFDALMLKNNPNVHITITNQVTGRIESANADAIRPGENTTINNHGLIFAFKPPAPPPGMSNAPPAGEDGIDFQDHSGGMVFNFEGGMIIGTKHGIASPGRDAMAATPATPGQPVDVTNYGTIRGEAGSGINLDTLPTTETRISNFGMITGTIKDGIASGDGVDVDGLVRLDNHGKIEALGIQMVPPQMTPERPVDAVQLSEAVTIGGGNIHNFAGATIVSSQRAITVDGGTDYSDPNMPRELPALDKTMINNEGMIQGAINSEAIRIVGSFDDTITNTASGRIEGDILTGGGKDTVTSSGFILGTIRAGDGDDTVNGSGSSSRVAVLGGNGHDSITGGSGNDELHGDTAFIRAPHGNDTLMGGGGNDLLFGEEGDDDLTGGPDRDTFIYRIFSDGGDGADTILDFKPGEDQIELRFLSGLLPTTPPMILDGNDVVLDFGDGNTIRVVGAGSFASPLMIGTDIIFTT